MLHNIRARKRTQSAIEFLTTYGWAILIISIIFLIFYFFVVAPSVVVPNQCTFSTSVTCRALIIGSNSLSSTVAIFLTNSQEYQIETPSVTFNITGIGSISGTCATLSALPGGAIICSANIPKPLNEGSLARGIVYAEEHVCTNIGTASCPNTAKEVYIGTFQSHTVPMLNPTPVSL